jgi:hypothetical protein
LIDHVTQLRGWREQTTVWLRQKVCCGTQRTLHPAGTMHSINNPASVVLSDKTMQAVGLLFSFFKRAL